MRRTTPSWLLLSVCLAMAVDCPAAHAEQFLEVPYLPEHRLTGDPGDRKDHAVSMHIHLPQAAGPRPCVILVHGGGWGGGDMGDAERMRSKNSYGHAGELIETGLDAGFVMVNLNYHLMPKGIFPAVYDDFRDALRFLRMHADRFHIDPTRIGATGFSAGGWLLGTACWTNGQYLLSREQIKQPTLLSDYVAGKDRKRKDTPYFSMGQARTVYPGHYGLCQAVSYDFQNNFDRLLEQKEFPAVNQWCGLDVPLKPGFAEAGMLFSQSVVTTEKYRGKGVHVPKQTTPAINRAGDEVILAEAIIDNFRESLIERCRTPLPEVRPGLQVFAKRCDVAFLTPDPSINVHFTTDGSTPTERSPTYDKPFTIARDTTVKAFAVMPGREPSLVTTAQFWQRPDLMPPDIVAPTGPELPPATVGKPYRLQFESDPPGATCWVEAGELLSYEPRKKKGTVVRPTGLGLDPKTGLLSGTPEQGGVFWVQVQVAAQPGGIGSLRNYRLRVIGGGSAPAATVAADTHVELCRLSGWNAEEVATLQNLFDQAEVSAHIQQQGKIHLVVVPADERQAARKAAEEGIEKSGGGAVNWSE